MLPLQLLPDVHNNEDHEQDGGSCRTFEGGERKDQLGRREGGKSSMTVAWYGVPCIDHRAP